MGKKRIVLTFPHDVVTSPIVYRLVKDYNIVVNILQASVTPKEEGRMVLEVTADDDKLEAVFDYLEGLGVSVESLDKTITWAEEKCTSCSACIAICPTEALNIDRSTMIVSFDKEKCIACGLCLKGCPYHAVTLTR